MDQKPAATPSCGVPGCEGDKELVVDRATRLARLVVGDIVHALYSDGTPRFCLVTAITESTIVSRAVTTQEHMEFDRRTGIERSRKGWQTCTISSVAPLPVEIHNVMLGLDRKTRLEAGTGRSKLNKAEIAAIGFATAHYRANSLEPLPSDRPAE